MLFRITNQDKDVWNSDTPRYELVGVECPYVTKDMPSEIVTKVEASWRITMQGKIRNYCRKNGDTVDNVVAICGKLGITYNDIVTYTGEFPSTAQPRKVKVATVGDIENAIKAGTITKEQLRIMLAEIS